MTLQYKIADKSDIEDLLAARCETLRAVCHLESDFKFTEKFLNDARNYFEQGHHTTVLGGFKLAPLSYIQKGNIADRALAQK